jgi:hypothetical protein
MANVKNAPKSRLKCDKMSETATKNWNKIGKRATRSDTKNGEKAIRHETKNDDKATGNGIGNEIKYLEWIVKDHAFMLPS